MASCTILTTHITYVPANLANASCALSFILPRDHLSGTLTGQFTLEIALVDGVWATGDQLMLRIRTSAPETITKSAGLTGALFIKKLNV
jgi:hypothetical protein